MGYHPDLGSLDRPHEAIPSNSRVGPHDVLVPASRADPGGAQAFIASMLAHSRREAFLDDHSSGPR